MGSWSFKSNYILCLEGKKEIKTFKKEKYGEIVQIDLTIFRKRKTITIPVHSNRDLPTSTLTEILKQEGKDIHLITPKNNLSFAIWLNKNREKQGLSQKTK